VFVVFVQARLRMGAASSRKATAVDAASNLGSCPAAPTPSGDSNASNCPVIGGAAVGEIAPPPIFNVYNQQINSPEMQRKLHESSAGGAGMFPGLRKGDGSGTLVLDPKNNMPLEANQRPAPGQNVPISTNRVQSTIPKGGTDSTWTYPSPQMFYNALVRKDKAQDVTPKDMESVVSVHNAMNEMTWQSVVQWERLHQYTSSTGPRLSRFIGRPHDFSPKARIHMMTGGEAPFDRHDWFIDRNGKEVRYVIDFYFDESKAGSMDAFSVDTRPALDSAESALDRVKMSIYQTAYKYGLPCPITGDRSSFSGNLASGTAGGQ